MKTLDELKKTRKPTEEAQALRKQYTRIKKLIKTSLKDGDKTIKEIAADTGLELDTVTFYLMTMRKYHEVEVGEIDDMDEYFFYKLKQ